MYGNIYYFNIIFVCIKFSIYNIYDESIYITYFRTPINYTMCFILKKYIYGLFEFLLTNS